MTKKIIFALSSGLLAGLVSYLYGDMIQTQLVEDYSKEVPTAAIFISCLVGTVIATIGHWLFTKFIPKFGELIFGLLFAGFTTASLIGVLGFVFKGETTEAHQYIFYCYAMPMHFLASRGALPRNLPFRHATVRACFGPVLPERPMPDRLPGPQWPQEMSLL